MNFDILAPLKIPTPDHMHPVYPLQETHDSLTYPTTIYTPDRAGFGYGL